MRVSFLQAQFGIQKPDRIFKERLQMFALLRVLGCDVEVVVTPMKRMVGKT